MAQDLAVLSQHDYKANKEHPCSAATCNRGGVIKPGEYYRRYVYEGEDGKFKTEKVHLSCLYDASQ